MRKWLKPRQMETERTDPPSYEDLLRAAAPRSDPQSNLWVIWNAAAVLLTLEVDPQKRALLFMITAATDHIAEELRERK